MSDSLDRFNWIASRYDFLSRLVFGKAIYESQICFLGLVPSKSNVLIIGGGSGKILPGLLNLSPRCHVWYIDASSKMLEIASNRIPAHIRDRVSFIHGTGEAIPAAIEFDVVITNFFLDLFPDRLLPAMCQAFSRKLTRHGLWLVTDFVNCRKWWHQVLLWLMYRFFVITCGIEGARLPAWEKHLGSAGLVATDSDSFYGGFIKSAVYKKSNDTMKP